MALPTKLNFFTVTRLLKPLLNHYFGIEVVAVTPQTYKLSQHLVTKTNTLLEVIQEGQTNEDMGYIASALYSLYACGWITIIEHEYPTYREWKRQHPGMQLDHKYPKQWFPLRAFDVDNWQPLTPSENENKSDMFGEVITEKLNQLMSEIKNIDDQFSGLF